MITKSTFVSQLSYSLGVGLLAWLAFFVTAHTEFTRAGAEPDALVVTEATITPLPTASSTPTDLKQAETQDVPVPPSATATPSCTPTHTITATPRPTRTWAPLFTQTAPPTEASTPTDTPAPVPTPTETVETLIGPPPDPDLTPPATPTRYGPGGGH